MERTVSEALPTRIRALAASMVIGLAALAAPAGAATVDLAAGVLSYGSLGDIANALVVSLAGGFYTVADPAGTPAAPSSSALAAGCVGLDDAALPALVRGGPGTDTVAPGFDRAVARRFDDGAPFRRTVTAPAPMAIRVVPRGLTADSCAAGGCNSRPTPPRPLPVDETYSCSSRRS